MAMMKTLVSMALVTGVIAASLTSVHAQRLRAPPVGSILGPSMMGPLGFRVMCSPRGAGYTDWRIDRIESAISLSESQRSAFETLEATSKQAESLIRAACPTDVPLTSVERLKTMEARLQATLQSVIILRPAFGAFYGTLSSDQRARFDDAGSNRWHLWSKRKR